MEEPAQNNSPKKESGIIFWIIVLMFFIGACFYFAGFRIEKNFAIAFPGSIRLEGLPSGVTIKVDGEERGATKDGGTSIIKFLSHGQHTVILEKDNYYVWQKDFFVKSNTVNTLHPFLISKNPEGSVIEVTDPEYEKIESLIKEQSGTLYATSTNGKITLSKNGRFLQGTFNGKLEEAPSPFCQNSECSPEIIIFSENNDVREIGFYKNRNDIALIAMGNGVYAVEIDSAGFQNYQALYKGKEPMFGISETGNLFITDQGILMNVNW